MVLKKIYDHIYSPYHIIGPWRDSSAENNDHISFN